MNLDLLTELVCRRLRYTSRAKLIGKEPMLDLGFQYVLSEPYDAVVLGILSPGVLLRMPTDLVCRALLTGIPVYFWPDQPYKDSEFCGPLHRELQSAEAYLLSLGVLCLPGSKGWITGEQARWMKSAGIPFSECWKRTPLAQDILEGNHDCWNSNR